MCVNIVSKPTWSSNPGDQIEQKQVGSPMAENNTDTETEREEVKEVIFIIIHCVSPGVELKIDDPISQCSTLSQHYS